MSQYLLFSKSLACRYFLKKRHSSSRMARSLYKDCPKLKTKAWLFTVSNYTFTSKQLIDKLS